MSKAPDISIVVPLYNEENVLPFLHERLTGVMAGLGLSYDIILVNDGSNDRTLELAQNYNRSDDRIKILSFSRNFGHQTAITAGLNFATGSAVMVIDGDLQDPPEIIPEFLEKWKAGFEVVYGIREKRKEGLVKRFLYKGYYRILGKLSKIPIPLDSGDCCLIDRRVVNLLAQMPERNRFIRGLRSWVGFRQYGLKYERDKRFAGTPKYTFYGLVKLGLDGIVSFSEIPLRVSVLAGFFISLLSFFYSFYIVVMKVMNPTLNIPWGWSSLVVAITFLGGVQLIVLGVLGEYLLRIYDEVKKRPQYVLDRVIGFGEDRSA